MNGTGRSPNLDRMAARRAQEVVRRAKELGADEADALDNTVTKALGVLQEDGIYACALFLESRPDAERQRADALLDEMLSLLSELPFGWGKPASLAAEDVLKHISDKVLEDLERLLLAKETLEQMLIYARYGAKAAAA